MDDTIRDLLEQLRISHGMFINDWQHKADEDNAGNYSDELKHAMAGQEALEHILDHG